MHNFYLVPCCFIQQGAGCFFFNISVEVSIKVSLLRFNKSPFFSTSTLMVIQNVCIIKLIFLFNVVSL